MFPTPAENALSQLENALNMTNLEYETDGWEVRPRHKHWCRWDTPLSDQLPPRHLLLLAKGSCLLASTCGKQKSAPTRFTRVAYAWAKEASNHTETSKGPDPFCFGLRFPALCCLLELLCRLPKHLSLPRPPPRPLRPHRPFRSPRSPYATLALTLAATHSPWPPAQPRVEWSWPWQRHLVVVARVLCQQTGIGGLRRSARVAKATFSRGEVAPNAGAAVARLSTARRGVCVTSDSGSSSARQTRHSEHGASHGRSPRIRSAATAPRHTLRPTVCPVCHR